MRYSYPLFVLLFVFGFKEAKAQYNSKDIIILDKQKELNEKRVDSILYTITNKDSLYAQIAHNFSYFFYKQKKEYNLAIKYGIIEVNTLDNLKIKNENHTNALYNIGKFYFIKNQYENAIAYYKKAIKSNAFPLKVAQSYCMLGECYFRKGDYYKSINHYTKGISLLEKLNSYKTTLIAKCNNLSRVCNKMDTPKSTKIGLFYLNKADSIIKNTSNLKVDDRSVYSLNVGFANLYALKHQYNLKKAKHYYLKNLNKATKEKNDKMIANSCLNIGELYLKSKNDSCIYFFKKSIKYDSINKIDIYETYRNTANYYISKNKFQKALIDIEKSLAYSFNVKNYNAINNLSSKQILNIGDKISIVGALRTRTETLIHLYNSTKNKEFLYKAINIVNFNDKLVELLLNHSNEIDTKLLWRNETSKTYILGVKAAYILQDEVTMHNFMEKNRALLLIQSIKQNISQLSLPINLANKRIELKERILKLEDIIDKNQGSNSYSKAKDSLFNLKEKYAVFNDSISKIHPNYFNNNLKPTSLEDVKSNLDNSSIIVSYISNTINTEETAFYGLIISNKNQYSFEVKNVNSLLKNAITFKNLISKPLKTKKELDSFKKTAYNLYNQLFPGDSLKQIIKNKHLVIIPGTIFQNIPFEALNVDKNALKYLIEENDISYTYSMSFSDKNNEVVRNTTKDFVGFSPVEFENKNLITLDNTEEEVVAINDILDGEIYTHKKSSKKTFIESGLNSKIIHLATHANSSQKPEIYFTRDTLKLHELYTLRNNADLVVLSACETNLGAIKKGEGVFSLARGFFYSGSNAVVSSLWNVNDTSTSFLMKNFYENLKNKQSKVKALNNAKRQYLSEHKLSEKSPYYWASFILIGDTDKTFHNNYYLLYLLGFIILLILFSFFFKNKG
ncbi:CHAT domain-containing tetratricopeptide repeat protein [uncultured Lacinutrix sp.]|uniref:CHAT domain-containing protein n=1 Tax=uncultured Lacinutrix sp. TaxID=574032 RepID=UPI00262E4B05|nr:CHAT domain-containing tetratricopeptide repeat protein [uncultured Lacinutrix sp.]